MIWSDDRGKLVQDLEEMQSSLNSSLFSYVECLQSYNNSMLKKIQETASFLKPAEMLSFHHNGKKETIEKV